MNEQSYPSVDKVPGHAGGGSKAGDRRRRAEDHEEDHQLRILSGIPGPGTGKTRRADRENEQGGASASADITTDRRDSIRDTKVPVRQGTVPCLTSEPDVIWRAARHF